MLDDEVFAERVFIHVKGHEVRVRIGIPRVCSEIDDGTWACDYQIVGLGDESVRKSPGVDAIQSFSLALVYVSSALYLSEDYRLGYISWEFGQDKFDLDLPVASAISSKVEAIRKGLK